METIKPEETQILGGLEIENGRVKNDIQSDRVWSLVTTKLQKIATAGNGWEQLYQDPGDGRYWELFFPHGELQGGGPPALRVIPPEAAWQKYDL
ncbi:MAG TPA: Imm27 family immunity protein [Granulicella sp.]|jgi:hypothetical protein